MIDDDMNIFRDMSYFEEMCWRAENEIDPESRGHAQYEVDRMVDAMNKAEEEERMATVPVSALGKINVNRLTEYINEEVRDYMEGLYFEPNDDITRAQLKAAVTEYLEDLKARRVLFDYEVVCDASNNSPAIVDQNKLKVDIAFKLQPGHDYYRAGGTAGPRVTYDAMDLSKIVDVDLTTPAGTVSNGNGSGSISVSPANGASVGASSIGSMVGQLTGVTLSLSPVNSVGYLDSKIQLVDPITDNPKLPSIDFHTHDDAGKSIKMTLLPEGQISAYESLQLMMLMQAAMTNPSSFSVYHFVRKNNLERHFKYSQ